MAFFEVSRFRTITTKIFAALSYSLHFFSSSQISTRNFIVNELFADMLVSITDVATRFEIFQSELPDSAENLSCKSDTLGQTFHPFPNLPTELRLKIWRACFPPNRKVVIKFLTLDGVKDISDEPNPPTLAINSESREETLLHYRPIFKFKDNPNHPGGPSRQYYCSKSDTVIFADNSLRSTRAYLLPELWGNASLLRENLRRVELQGLCWDHVLRLCYQEPLFTHLTHFTLITQQHTWYGKPVVDIVSCKEEAQSFYPEFFELLKKQGRVSSVPVVEIRVHPQDEAPEWGTQEARPWCRR